ARGKFASVTQQDLDIGAGFDHMMVRRDVTVGRNNDARAHTACLTFPRQERLPSKPLITKESAEQRVIQPFLIASIRCGLSGGIDADNRGHYLLHYRRKGGRS